MKNKFIEKLEFYLVYSIFLISKLFPEKSIRRFIRHLIKFIFNIIISQKKIAYKNLSIINPEYSKEEKKIIYKKFLNIYGEIFADQILFNRFTKEDILRKMDVSGYENAKKILDQKKSVIIGLGHLGNWELLGSHASLQGYKINVIYRPLDNKLIDKILTEFRTKYGIRLISKFSSPINMIRPLMNNETLCIVADQNTIRNFVYIPFLGKIAAASKGLSFFHLKTLAPICFAYSLIDENLKQYGFIEEQYDFENLYDNLSIKEKYFLYLFNKRFNNQDSSQEFTETKQKFDRFFISNYNSNYIINNEFIVNNLNKQYYDQYLLDLNNFKNQNKEYKEMDFEEKSFYITYFFHKSLEKIIKKYPENWLLFHPRFRKQPDGFKSIYN